MNESCFEGMRIRINDSLTIADEIFYPSKPKDTYGYIDKMLRVVQPTYMVGSQEILVL